MPVPSFIPVLSELSDEQVFQVVNVVLPAWLLVALAPKSKLTALVVYVAVTVLAVVYGLNLWYAAATHGGLPALMGEFMSFDGVARLMAEKSNVLMAWVHYGVTDLMTGYWEALDAARRGVPKLLIWACLVGTMLFGPVGVLAYLVVRTLFGREPRLPQRKRE